MKVIISAGGTGGHIFPAIAVADALRQENPTVEILFVGAEGKMEMERVPKAGYEIRGLPITGFQRRLTFENVVKNLKLIYKLPLSLWRVRQILKTFKPDIAIGFGGFASGPTLRAAASLGIPTVLQEQNSYAGVTNKLLAEKAAAICTAYPEMEKFFPKEKIVLTGNPVRQDILDIQHKRAEGYAYFGLDSSKKTIVVLGGSLGAKTMNIAMEHNAQNIENQHTVQILWQCGKLYEADFKNGKTASLHQVKMSAFLDRMDLAYAVADVVIARAGALTVSELCLAACPTVLVPSPNVAEDHQTKNALALVNKNAAILVRDADAKEKMVSTALEILKDVELQKSLSKNMRDLGKPNAAADIVAVIKKIVA
jgi:UDP-N-acetylglucosamine--N-acetylmuramyl-(pentapeptide) pyrophosphoryl-undecaprenol N-acetylglucosamine transferase